MPISKKNIIVAGAAAVAILIVTVVIIAVRRSHPVIFKPCDGTSGPVENIEIPSCPNSAKVGYCELKLGSETEVKMSFTPKKDYDSLAFKVDNPSMIVTVEDNVCNYGAICPLKAGRQEKFNFWMSEYKGDSGLFKVNIFVPDDKDPRAVKEEVYCVQFPVKVV